MAEKPRQNVVDLGLVRETGRLAQLVREIAADTEKVFFTDHAVRRMWERGISDAEVYKVLRLGHIHGQPWIEDGGDKACKVVMPRRGERTTGVITIIVEPDGELVIKTVEWED
ncbi:DUF4258 domain-containing protein [Brevundimonas sp.]|uniref:DUF4258 domain-containing protein n=1 Tax=Brevundimonas sp. TaxID=1871086 RepID=UPI0025BB372B|nr:DUF4258 domain-containing protein [Brevundimonas sp.]